ncbi:MAG: hypothetical protein ACJAZO_001267 [Myxococcota bacterium]
MVALLFLFLSGLVGIALVSGCDITEGWTWQRKQNALRCQTDRGSVHFQEVSEVRIVKLFVKFCGVQGIA